MFSGTIWRRIWRILEREWKNFNLVWISMRKRSNFGMRNEYYFEILRTFLEECLMERFGKVGRISLEKNWWRIPLSLNFVEETIDFWDRESVFSRFWDSFGTFFRRMLMKRIGILRILEKNLWGIPLSLDFSGEMIDFGDRERILFLRFWDLFWRNVWWNGLEKWELLKGIEKFHLVWILMRKRSNLQDREKYSRDFGTFLNIWWNIENSWKEFVKNST